MTYTNIKFAARHKDTKEFLYLKWGSHLLIGRFNWGWVEGEPDFDNISLYSARNVFEEDLCYLARQEPDFKLDEVEIVRVEINYEVP